MLSIFTGKLFSFDNSLYSTYTLYAICVFWCVGCTNRCNFLLNGSKEKTLFLPLDKENMLNYGINAPHPHPKKKKKKHNPKMFIHYSLPILLGEGKWTLRVFLFILEARMRFDGDVDTFRSMTVKITEIKTRNNSTSVFNDSMWGFLIYVFSGLNNTYVCVCWLPGRYRNISSFRKFPIGDLISDSLYMATGIVYGKTLYIFVGHC